MDMDVVGNKERLLKGILDGETTTDIEPASREERLLKAILENGGGGGGGATSVTLTASGSDLSGDVSLADLKTALANGVVLLSFPTDGNADERVVAEYTDDSTNGLRIGVFSEDEYIVYSVVDDGNDGVTLTVESKTNTNPYYDYTPTAEENATIMSAFQTYLTAGIQAAGTPIHTRTNGDFTALSDAVEAATAAGQIFRMRLSMGGLSDYILVAAQYGLNNYGHGLVAGVIPYTGALPGTSITAYTMINTLTGYTGIDLFGTVFTS